LPFEGFSFEAFSLTDVFRLESFGQRLITTISLSHSLYFVGHSYHRKKKAITAATPIAMPAFLPTVRPAKSLQRRTFYEGASAKILLVAKEVDGNSPM